MKIINIYKKREELIESLKKFYEENGRSPKMKDFTNNPKYPGYKVYYNYFGSWNEALKLAELDLDTAINKGSELSNSYIKGRFFEKIVFESFEKSGAVDVSGKYCRSIFDGICPKGKTYDAKSSKLYVKEGRRHWKFGFRKDKRIDKIDYLILGGFDENFSSLMILLLIPIEIIGNKRIFRIYIDDVRNYKQYNITDKVGKEIKKYVKIDPINL